MSTAEAIYKYLDTFTGGIEEFLAATADETYKSTVYEPFHITTMGGRSLTFGFYKEMGGDMCPDPQYGVRLKDLEADVESLRIYTLLGHVFEGGGGGQAEDCADFLKEMVSRKNNGVMTLTDRVTYP